MTPSDRAAVQATLSSLAQSRAAVAAWWRAMKLPVVRGVA